MRPAALLGFALLCGCGSERTSDLSALLLTLDTTRADALSCYGNARGTTPALDSLAAEGVLFEAAHTVAPLTLPAHATMLTGLYPLRHGLRDNGVAALSGSGETLAEAARAAGLRTAAFVSSVVLDDTFGLDQGFEHYDVPPRGSWEDDERHLGAERPARVTIDAALAWLRTLRPGERFFLWIHLYDPHFPYAPPAPFEREFQDSPYFGEVAAMDREIGRLLDALRADGTLEHTFVLALSDHGESLGEHGELTHGAYCYESTLRIPMIARFPSGVGDRRAGERSSELVSAADVGPTLAEALGLPGLPPGPARPEGTGPARPAVTGPDGLSFFRQRIPDERGLYFESYFGYLNYGWSPLAGWMDRRGKYLHSSEPELFDLNSDPAESQDRAREPGVELEPYRRALAALASRPALERSQQEIDEDTLAGIQGLGYAALGDPSASLPHPLEPSDAPSPRSQQDFLAESARGKTLAEQGAIDEAAAIYEKLLSENPRNFLVLERLATYRLKQRRAADAVELLQQLVRTGPQRGKSYYELGIALRADRRPQEAIEALQRAVDITNGRRRYVDELVEVLRKAGRAAEAEELETRFPRAKDGR